MMDSVHDWTQSIVAQLEEITATSEDGEHLLVLGQVQVILPPDLVVSAGQASAYLVTGEWADPLQCNDFEDCVLWSHVTWAQPEVVDEDQMVAAVSRPSLAQLYKKARATGLVPASPQGYF
jgi:hypothetical protein